MFTSAPNKTFACMQCFKEKFRQEIERLLVNSIESEEMRREEMCVFVCVQKPRYSSVLGAGPRGQDKTRAPAYV